MTTEQVSQKRKCFARLQPRKRYSVGAQISAAEYQRLELEWTARGCSPSELVRAALGVDEAAAACPLLVAAGQVVRAGNAHAAAVRRGDLSATSAAVDALNRHAATLIGLAAKRELPQ